MTRCSCSAHGTFLTAKGLEEAAQRELELSALAGAGIVPYLDVVGSVSAPPEAGSLFAFVTDDMTDQQYRRFLDGS